MGNVPDAALAGKSLSQGKYLPGAFAFLFVGCEARNGGTPVVRVTVSDQLGVKLSLPSTPVAEIDAVPEEDEGFKLTLDGIAGSREFYAPGTKARTYTMIQFDADPREMGRFGADDIAGKTMKVDLGGSEVSFVLPAPGPELLRVLSACHVSPWKPSSPAGVELSEKFRAKAIAYVQHIASIRGEDRTPLQADAVELGNVTVTEGEDEVGNVVWRFAEASEKEKPVSARRTKCAAALTATLRTGVYHAPEACAYFKSAAVPTARAGLLKRAKASQVTGRRHVASKMGVWRSCTDWHSLWHLLWLDRMRRRPTTGVLTWWGPRSTCG